MTRILIDNSGYSLDNIGDIAMLQVAVQRLRAALQDADIHVITNSVDRCATYCPDVKPVSLDDGQRSGKRDLLLPTKRALRALRHNFPFVDEGWARLTSGMSRSLRDKSVVDAGLADYDCLVVSGGGFFTDQFALHAIGVLNTIEKAVELRIPVFIFGNGFGPITHPGLIQRCKEVLPSVRCIGIREPSESRRLLVEFGVNEKAIVFTGDDALEVAHDARDDGPASGIGLNVRYQSLPTIRRGQLLTIRRCVKDFSRAHSALVHALPISIDEWHPDARTMQCIIQGLSYVAACEVHGTSPAQVLASVAKCGVVITGSYHAAVFGLAQGKPVVCLTNTPYYSGKFDGLKRIYGDGVDIVDITIPSFERVLRVKIDVAWDLMASAKASILAKTEEQIARSRELYSNMATTLLRRKEGRYD
jgi:colanic acid/amylovoran biosynthesis protein